MDYVVGSVAALISGNVTPNRPKLLKRALTPKKHPLSPDITPKSETEDRSIFLSPTLQKKKSIVKKSPKRIFDNPELDETNEKDEQVSPKADKVKKHLKDDLDADTLSPKSPKNARNKHDVKEPQMLQTSSASYIQVANESTPRKKKKKQLVTPLAPKEETDEENLGDEAISPAKASNSPKKKCKSNINVDNQYIESNDLGPKNKRKSNTAENQNIQSDNDDNLTPKKKKKSNDSSLHVNVEQQIEGQIKKKSKKEKKSNDSSLHVNVEHQIKGQTEKKSKKKKKKQKQSNQNHEAEKQEIKKVNVEEVPKKKKKLKNIVNLNAITQEDSESEHDSDNDIESENEINNKEVLDLKTADESSEEEDEPKPEKKQERTEQEIAEEAKRTLFVGNVPFSAKTKKEIKNIFNKYGKIETIRIRNVPVKDARMTPKLAVIKKELHPERSTVIVYVKFHDSESVDKALVENNTVLNNCHLKVTRSDVSGQYDQRRAVFVGNLPFAIEDEGLRAKFDKCGEIESVRIVRDRKTGAGKGFGYVNFKSVDGVELALGLSEEDLTIKNRILRVKRCTATLKQNKAFNQNRTTQQSQRHPSQKPNRQGHPSQKPNRQGHPSQKPSHQKFSSQNRLNQPGQSQNEDGAFRRILNKRQNDDVGAGPANKRIKQRKEFVGFTADKNKKHKFNKGQKKKRALSEILTK